MDVTRIRGALNSAALNYRETRQLKRHSRTLAQATANSPGEFGLLLAPDVALFAHQPLGVELEERDPDKVLVAAVLELDSRAPLDDNTISVYDRLGKLRIG